MSYCANCGAFLEPQDRFCGRCGHPAEDAPEREPERASDARATLPGTPNTAAAAGARAAPENERAPGPVPAQPGDASVPQSRPWRRGLVFLAAIAAAAATLLFLPRTREDAGRAADGIAGIRKETSPELPVHPADRMAEGLEIQTGEGVYGESADSGTIFVVEGSVRNRNPHPVRFIRLQGTFRSNTGATATAFCYAGRTVDSALLKHSDPQSIQIALDEPYGDDPYAYVPSGGALPYMMVFTGVPPGPASYTVRVRSVR